MLEATLDHLRAAAHLLTDGEAGDYDSLLKFVGEARQVTLGTASSGSHELFHARAEVTKRLVREKGFTWLTLSTVPVDATAAEGLERFVKGDPMTGSLASDALSTVTASPRWLWRNAEMLDFLGWLRTFNDHFSGDRHKVSLSSGDGPGADSSRKSIVWTDSQRIDGPAADARKELRVSFNTYCGTVVASDSADTTPRRQSLPPAAANTVEALCHALELPRFWLPVRGASQEVAQAVRTRAGGQVDALVYFDETRSLEPLDPSNPNQPGG
jgi:erythromycin esterase-like protein